MSDVKPLHLFNEVYVNLCSVESAFAWANASNSIAGADDWREAFEKADDYLSINGLSIGAPLGRLMKHQKAVSDLYSRLIKLGFQCAKSSKNETQRQGLKELVADAEAAMQQFTSCLAVVRPESVLVDSHFYWADHNYGEELEHLRALHPRCINEPTNELFQEYLAWANRHLDYVESQAHKKLPTVRDIPKLRSILNTLEVQLMVSEVTDE